MDQKLKIQAGKYPNKIKTKFVLINPSDTFINHLIVITWLFYEEDEERSKDKMQYSIIIDIILNLLEHHTESLKKKFEIYKVVNIIKMICMIKGEI